jgi:hypothetical protein
MSTAGLKVVVAPPEVSGETVRFRWEQSAPNRFQRANEFFFHFEGIDLGGFSSLLFHEIFLGLQLRVFAGTDGPVEIVFPEPIPRTSAAFWLAFHGVEDQVSIAPLADVDSYFPWAPGHPPRRDRRTAAVFFGGGKDSTLASCLFSELYGPDEVVLIQSVGPLRPDPALAARLEARQEGLMLRPARERLGVATQRMWTDYQAQFLSGAEHLRPHLELYTVGALPALLSWGVSLCAFGTPRTAYLISRQPNGRLFFRYGNSRPEVLATQSTHYQRVLGADLTVSNVNFMFTTLMDFRLLAERYPHAVEQIVMCTHGGVEQPWCYQCRKCGEYVLLSLRCGVVDPRFDYDYFFSSSRYIAQIVTYAESGVELSVFGNARWRPLLSVDNHYLTFCHAIALIDPTVIADRLGPTALANLMIVKALFGNRLFPNVELLSTKSVDLIGSEVARTVARIAAEHFEVVDDLPGPFLSGNEEVTYDFDLLMPTRTALLDHIRS